MDLFDWLDIIKKLRDEGLTQSQIGERIGWSESKVKQYSALLSTVVTQVLNLARQYQIGRVTPEVTFATFNFTEGWFRNSGLYDLCEKYQLALIEAFIQRLIDSIGTNLIVLAKQHQKGRVPSEGTNVPTFNFT